jgi:hypothetical protein
LDYRYGSRTCCSPLFDYSSIWLFLWFLEVG